MTEPETLALLEVKGSEALEKSPPQALVPNGRQPEGEGEAETHGAASSKVGSSAGSTTAGEVPEDGLDSTVSEAATLPWGTGPPPSALFPDPPGWRDMEPEPLRSEPPTKLEDLSEDDANLLPEKAARAFVPIDLQCIERRPQEDPAVRCEAGEGEGRRACVPARPTQPEPCERKWAEAVVRPPGHTCRGCGGCGGRDGLRAVASVGAALILFPCLLYGAYAFLPFDAPRLPTMSSRLIYTLRCGVFATFPIILGLLVYGLSLLCFSALRPFGERRREVEIHRRFVAQSVQLFILYFFNLAVLSTYLPQETLKLLPLLTGLFAVSRLIYWLTFAVGRSFRGFGYGLTFLPLLSMLVWNLYYMFVVEPERMLAAAESRLDYPDHARSASDLRPRPWG
ncbi:transmembrane protein 79 [Mustela erminea]|uniref:transmembrane protein 79 n=1 Tax=Mustela erminea TaxID=36723 RepID=UPI001386A11B|nr:transmembrane protein 79 [Mustela erminea]XP_032174783.1 transmembrane protein 79 [Mustela erminea]XP_032174784.1 transmembrane protein 79 [Mustela erminea]XP_032174785.1 transmembrane protein 79 [Mustela erminea]XP_032174786.1 transmembrane protein 79 [Mustela erminea]XP_032174787.1 transmembrane protein 79 [Mustela erminea]XP_032174788.1 transmembrane protein 79 [Mustela erminea]XP_032174789.1 transmembrane protein 79 [Mustela erminea]XP_032174790.1 transmembrane protein 79 [Mustela er